jgi:hypothetical protein
MAIYKMIKTTGVTARHEMPWQSVLADIDYMQKNHFFLNRLLHFVRNDKEQIHS